MTVDKVTRPLAEPFLVIATQNPLETLGTFPLPEAQMDRFLMQISMENLSPAQERAMVERFLTDEPLDELAGVCAKEDIIRLQETCREVYLHPELLKYIVDVIHATRSHAKVLHGVSPRGTLAFVRASQGYALVQGRDYIVPEDIKAVAIPVLAHRLNLAAGEDEKRLSAQIVSELLSSVPLPTEDWGKR